MKVPYVVLGMLLGVAGVAGFRAAFAQPEAPTHYHANFALFVDGARVDLSGDEYMEDVATCAQGETVLPRSRAHLHNNDPDVAHVHHRGVTWGHLFANLGIGVGQTYLAEKGGAVRTAGEGRTLKFVLNGRPQFAIHNELVRPGDRALVSYGTESEAEVLRDQYPQVADNAPEFDTRDDPAGCAGAHRMTFWERIRYAFTG
jgi:hypothetical protein